LRFGRNLLRTSPVGPVLAEHRERSWLVGARRYLRIDCEAQLMLALEHADGARGEVFGPFGHLSSIDGVLYADRRRFAIYHEGTRVWTLDPAGTGWAVMVARSG
jgi:hypothetical protein